MDGRPAKGVRVRMAAPVTSAREISGVELSVGDAAVTDGALVADFAPFQVRSFALKIAAAPVKAAMPQSQPVVLPCDRIVAGRDGTRPKGGFDNEGRSLPAEMLPGEIPFAGITFQLAPSEGPQAVTARGQSINLPAGQFTRLYILAASADGDLKVLFRIGNKIVDLTVQDWGGYIGQWDNRIWNTREEPVPPRPGAPAPAPGAKPRMRTVMEYAGLTPGFIKPAPVAWFASHRHSADGDNEPYSYCYLFGYAIDLPSEAKTLTLPENDNIRILAVTLAKESEPVLPVQPLVDTPER
jgi:alpha-mannosidase